MFAEFELVYDRRVAFLDIVFDLCVIGNLLVFLIDSFTKVIVFVLLDFIYIGVIEPDAFLLYRIQLFVKVPKLTLVKLNRLLFKKVAELSVTTFGKELAAECIPCYITRYELHFVNSQGPGLIAQYVLNLTKLFVNCDSIDLTAFAVVAFESIVPHHQHNLIELDYLHSDDKTYRDNELLYYYVLQKVLNSVCSLVLALFDDPGIVVSVSP